MDIWTSLTAILANPTVQNFLISCGASVSWDAVKVMLKKAELEDSFELQVYQVLKETFEAFYFKYNLEFDEKIVMISFLEAIKGIHNFDSDAITKKMVSDTIGLEVTDQALKEWTKIFVIKCSNPKYQWLYNKLSFSSMKSQKGSKNTAWMKEHMHNNFCKIQCDMIDELPPIFGGINTQLSQACWYDTQVLIWEIVFNAQEHGHAKKCVLHITERSITVSDDGERFNPLSTKEQFVKQGGSIAIRKFMHDYPEIVLKSDYCHDINQFTVDFCDDVFDVNGMSEIIVPSLIPATGNYQLKYQKGKFKYYYIDVDEIPKRKNCLFATFSGIIGLFEKLRREHIPQTIDGKVFIYFSDMTRTDYQAVCSQMKEILNEFGAGRYEIEIVFGQETPA